MISHNQFQWSPAAAVTALLAITSAALADEVSVIAPPDFAAVADTAPYDFAPEESALDAEESYSEIEIIRERYPNRRVKIEREVTTNAEGSYVNHGTWKNWDEAGTLIAEGQYQMGRRVGVWTRWHTRRDAASLREHPFNSFQAPFVSQATFNDDVMDGEWIIFDSKQRKCCQITLQKGKRNGTSTVWLPSGQVYREAVYEDGLPVGDVMQRDRQNELKPVASYINGRRVTTKVTYFPKSKEKKTEALYLGAKTVVSSPDDFWDAKFAEYDSTGDEHRHGPWKTWYANGQLQLEGFYRHDKELGTFSWWHPNGQKAVEGEYKDGLQNGPWVWWHVNGQKATSGSYTQGVQQGTWSRWKQDGRIDQRTVYDPKVPADLPHAQVQEPREFETGQKFPILPWMKR